MATDAPSATIPRAIPFPIPRPPPVTRTTLPSSLPTLRSSYSSVPLRSQTPLREAALWDWGAV